jgi:hypothetical protein
MITLVTQFRTELLTALKILIIAVILFLQLGAACCGPGCGKPPQHNTTSCPTRALYDCCDQQYSSAFPYVNMGNYAYSNACNLGGGYNNTCYYEDVSVKKIGCRLRICAPQTIPTNWKKTGVETDISKCAGDTYSQNIWIIEKYQ